MLRIVPMNRELCHRLYQDWENDPAIYMEGQEFFTYHYDEGSVNKRFDRQQTEDRRYFAILLNEEIIGEVLLKSIDFQQKSCVLSIHLQNDEVKGKGYGTEAERLAIAYAFDELGMETVFADVLKKNLRSQHILHKLGFTQVNEDEQFVYYQLKK